VDEDTPDHQAGAAELWLPNTRRLLEELPEAVRTGEPVRTDQAEGADAGDVARFQAAMADKDPELVERVAGRCAEACLERAPEGGRALDVGGGPGVFARALRDRGFRVTLFDTPEVIDRGPDIRVGSARYPAEPTCYINDYGDHGVRLNLRYWVKTPYYLARVRSKVNDRVWDGLDDVEVTIAYPHTHHVFDRTSGQLGVTVDGPGVGDEPA
jgi:small-conductance mechanosensitive channel